MNKEKIVGRLLLLNHLNAEEAIVLLGGDIIDDSDFEGVDEGYYTNEELVEDEPYDPNDRETCCDFECTEHDCCGCDECPCNNEVKEVDNEKCQCEACQMEGIMKSYEELMTIICSPAIGNINIPMPDFTLHSSNIPFTYTFTRG